MFLWVQTSAWSPSEVKTWVTVISFLVSVPVLSEQITLQQPSRNHRNNVTMETCSGCTPPRPSALRTQSLHDGKLLDDGSLLHHAHHAERQRHRHHDGQTLWDGRHRQAATQEKLFTDSRKPQPAPPLQSAAILEESKVSM